MIDAVRAVVRTRAGRQAQGRGAFRGRQREEIRGRGGGGAARGPAPPAERLELVGVRGREVGIVLRGDGAATFFSFFRSFFRRFRFFSSLRSRFRFFSFLRRRLRLRSSLLELLELELELELLLLLEDAIRGAKPVTAAAHDERAGQQCVRVQLVCTAALAACGAVRAGLVRSMRCQRTAARELWLQ